MIYKFRIFIIFHDTINIDYYNESILNNLVFINVRKENIRQYPGLNIVNLFDFKEYLPLGKNYAESEVIYNVYRNKYLIDDVDYVGFLHHDIDCLPLTPQVIQSLIKNNNIVSFETHPFKADYDKNFLMDISKPNVLFGKGINCYDVMTNDYNIFYNTQCNIDDFYNKNSKIILCSCFLLNKEIFYDLMEFSGQIIESKKLELFDKKQRFRVQGGLMERYYATWFLLKKIPFTSFRLQHNFFETKKQNTLIRRLIVKIQSKL